MNKITLEDHFKLHKEYESYYNSVKKACISGNTSSLYKSLQEEGIAFLFLGPCDQCGKYFDKYIILKGRDDYCRDIKCLVCENCLNNAITTIKKKEGTILVTPALPLTRLLKEGIFTKCPKCGSSMIRKSLFKSVKTCIHPKCGISE